ncbi:hypothetical protein GW17_00007575 [Ensete ventricosum]|uniref:Uncharacterized protein n=1 Tax=Ensete ventricosum TaxID=4639 RepID=A0A444FZD4_ENSVE|nr:hypothetical protein B296_00043451 [Ensete ventricosum]RWW27978.1 hypothetical protein GW17_00007575 [Ensete ventricosum]RZS15046.1 hypothetical protein BHM03_00046819 [Ensete ventricosum]
MSVITFENPVINNWLAQCLQLSNAGGRLIISSDGVWDALASEVALNYSRGLPADVAADQIVKVKLENFETKGSSFRKSFGSE